MTMTFKQLTSNPSGLEVHPFSLGPGVLVSHKEEGGWIVLDPGDELVFSRVNDTGKELYRITITIPTD